MPTHQQQTDFTAGPQSQQLTKPQSIAALESLGLGVASNEFREKCQKLSSIFISSKFQANSLNIIKSSEK
jgi:hypothetical protein